MKKTVILLLALFAIGIVAQPARPSRAAGQSLVFDVLVFSSYVPAGATPGTALVNGAQCGNGILDGQGSGVFNVVYVVPDSCAAPGAQVRFFVDGYMLKDTAVWGASGQPQTTLTTTFAQSPAGLYGGWAFGVSDGATVEARVGSVSCGTATTVQLGWRTRVPLSRYVLRVSPATLPPQGKAWCGYPGAQVDIFVNGVKVSHTPWSPGLHLLNLNQ